MSPHLNERQRRLWAGSEASAIGPGGIALVSRATGLDFDVVSAGRRELDQPDPLPPERSRRAGAGRKPIEVKDPGLWPALHSLIEPTAMGDPMHPLQWVCKSLRHLSAALTGMGHPISHEKVGEVLAQHGFRLQSNRKTQEGGDHPDRNAQFEYISDLTKRQLAAGQPVVSVDAKKKELVGAYRNAGREYRPQGQPEEVQVYDFVGALGRATPYGVYDLAANQGWVSVGVTADTAEFAVATLRRWWQELGSPRYPAATQLLICADGGGSNGSRTRLWKVALQRFADDSGLRLTVCHLPPGTSKWNKIEHRLFSFITLNWRGKPLVNYQTIVSLIGATTTAAGLTVRCELDPSDYPKGIKVSDEELAQVNLKRHDFHGDWNYTILPHGVEHTEVID